MFWKLRILIKLHKSAESWSTLFDCFPNNDKLFNAIKFLKSRHYIVEGFNNEYRLSDRASLRKYVWDCFNPFISLVGLVGGTLAIFQFLFEYCMK